MKNNIFLLCFATASILLGGCKEDDFNPSSVELTVTESVNGDIKPVSAATVRLYRSIEDWRNDVNSLGTSTSRETNKAKTTNSYNYVTDINGKLRIIGVAPGTYYLATRKACLQNPIDTLINVTGSATKELFAVSMATSQTGRIKITNNSETPFRVSYVRSGVEEVLFDIPAKTTKSKMYIPTGSYTVKAVQLDGIVGGTPRQFTFPGSVGCGTSLLGNIPA